MSEQTTPLRCHCGAPYGPNGMGGVRCEAGCNDPPPKLSCPCCAGSGQVRKTEPGEMIDE